MARSIRSLLPLSIAALVTLVSCGGGGDDDGNAAESTEPTEAAAQEIEEATAEDEQVEEVENVADTTEAPAAAETTIAISAVDILTDFGDVCRGVTLPGATAYDAARAGVHPIVTMGGESPEYEAMGFGLPEQWNPVVGEEQTVELVVCLDRTAATLSQSCGGYLDDAGADTGNTVEVYDTTYNVRLVAATTGDEVASTQMDASDEECPMFVFFDADQKVKAWYSEPTDALTAWLAPYVET
jgi:hypothetical protein